MTVSKSSRLKGFYKLRRSERLDAVREFTNLAHESTRILSGQESSLPFDIADLFIENAIGSFPLPLGIATNFRVNGRDFVVPMAVEESSVVAAASNGARWVYDSGGFTSEVVSSSMIGQIQLLDLAPETFEETEAQILAHKGELLQLANEIHPRLLMRGGGARDVEVRSFPQAELPFMVVHILLDTRDAMGANLVNTVCEKLAPSIAAITGARIGLRILSNLADRKVFRTTCRLNPEILEVREADAGKVPHLRGPEIARRIHEAFVFADHDVYRACTHNKGVMNGIDPAVIATGNDWRAVEAGAHAYACRTGRYRSLTTWRVDGEGFLCGQIEIPLQLGTVGGVTRIHPMAKVALQILGNPSAEELGKMISCAGLASNLAALRALTTVGIQRGHMKLHAKNLALTAGCKGSEIETVAMELVRRQSLTVTAAEEMLALLRTTGALPALPRASTSLRSGFVEEHP